MNKVIIIFKGMLQQEMRSGRVTMGYLLGLTFLTLGLNNFLRYVNEIKEPVNIFEVFIVTANQSMAGRLWMLGYLLIVADAPFVKANTYITLYRSGRHVWSMGMLFYVLIQAFLYTMCFATVSVVAGTPFGFCGRIWSSPVYMLATGTSSAIAGNYNLYFDGMAMMKHMMVPQAFGITFLYMFCYLAFIGVLLYVCSLVLCGFWGLAAVAVVHLGGRFVSFLTKLPRCPVSYVDGAGSHWRYPCIFLALILIMSAVSLFAVRRVDIQTKTKGGT